MFTAINISAALLGWSVGGFFLGLLLAWLTMKFLNGLTLLILQIKFYGFSHQGAEELLNDSEDAVKAIHAVVPDVNQVMLKIINTPDKPLGRFMDAEFYEWVDVAGQDSIVHRFLFSGTVDMSKGLPQKIADGCILLPPGILYQVDTPINKVT
jgi:hypothetical protein